MSHKSKIFNSKDSTIQRNNIKFWANIIKEYELVKAKKSTQFKFAEELYKFYGIKRQNFFKYYNRFKQNHDFDQLLPQKRGPKVKSRKFMFFVQDHVIKLREVGLNYYEISKICKERYKKYAPSRSSVYNILKDHNLNRLNEPMKRNQRKIIREKAGELGHIDCHYLPKGIIENDNNRYYLVGLIDDATRLVWVDIVPNIKSLTVMFSTLGIMNMMANRYELKFSEMLSDNGSEFGAGPEKKNKESHPFEFLLKKLHIKHRYTRPYRPQTNGKIERFWKTLKSELLDDYVFKDMEELEHHLAGFLVYYNEERPHQSLGGKTPQEQNKQCHRIT
ncbi:MAG: transposase family protein [Proteobacteria bacterium]|nr:transposase family protein [Pseudomonadota bacterium]